MTRGAEGRGDRAEDESRFFIECIYLNPGIWIGKPIECVYFDTGISNGKEEVEEV